MHDAATIDAGRLDAALGRALEHFFRIQAKEGHWVFDLEADVTITAEYILYKRFMGLELDPGLKGRLAAHIRRKQLPDGGWPLFDVDGHANLSASVKAYFALKLCGDSANAPHMVRARQLILSLGGAAKANVFTRYCLCLFGQMPWRVCPAMPVEAVLLPNRFFFNCSKISYWSRVVVIPLLIIYALKPVCRLRPEEAVQELFVTPPAALYNLDGFRPGSLRKNAFILLDRILKLVMPYFPRGLHERAVREAERWVRERMRGVGGIGGVFPSMVNAVEALHLLGCGPDDPDLLRGAKAVDDLVVDRGGEEAFCQPCVSPVWDTCLALSAVLEAGTAPDNPCVTAAADWLLDRQVFVRGDWAGKATDLAPGGWAFQFENALYPDLDDTAMVLMALFRAGALKRPELRERIAKAVNWVIGMQGSDGGWGAFDIDNNALYLNDIPFADHGALLDPSTADVTGRCVEMLAMLGHSRHFPPIARGLAFLRRQQEKFGAWYGRWGCNYIYGTWSVLAALRQVGEDTAKPSVRKAAAWLKGIQNRDGGFGETLYSYDDPSLAGTGGSTPSQTAWALLGLMAAGEAASPEVARGVAYLQNNQGQNGAWDEKHYTGTGFPRVFSLRYHGYCQYFPLWALGVYRRLSLGQKTRQMEVSLSRPLSLPLPALK